jgi:uncharacterized repeat protein (TIGR01451 family)
MAPLGFDPQSFVRKLFSIPTKLERHNSSSRGLTARRRTRRHGQPALAFETLESRQMMAADMAEIIGTVRLDVQGDGNAANDTLVAGATVQLYRDNGNGAFDVGDAIVGGAATTDVLGQYRFNGLGAGKYFVKLTLPPALQSKPGQAVQEINITALEAEGTVGQTIDGFDSTQVVEAAPPRPSSQPSSLLDPNVVGGERDMFVELTDGDDLFSSVSLITAGGYLRLASGSMVTGNAKIVWDGQDGDATTVNPTGLGGLDFTSFNGNTMTGLMLSVGADHPNCVVKLKVYTNAGKWSEFTATVPQTQGGAATKVFTFNFDGTPTTSAGGGVDFSSVGAIELTFVGVSAVDAQVSVVGLIGLTTKTADFTAYNRLSLGDRVWNDANNDGQLGAGEQGVSGVKMNLYNDVDGNNQYTAGVDTLVGSTTTNATGHYQFTDLLPGAYLVQVDAVNFQIGQALAGLKSSSGAAVDPDNGVDNDDNGSPLAGFGVVSQAISLTSSNNTLDFGFYGFDLVLDKSIEQHNASPLETVAYTVRVINDGPSTAKNVQFVDNLPEGVTYKSHTVSKGGVTLTHSGGTLAGAFGNMTAGEVIIVTILAEVKATATGTLLNEAEVSAPDEENILNNRDEVETPIIPKIDLAIDKIDSKDPVKPGETFSYTVTVTNHGPSNATGVTVIDTLPASGVSYVGASIPVNASGGILRFDLGNLASGASTTFTITVKVNDGFSGTLLNTVDVSAIEQETDYTNNQDTEPTLVKIDPADLGGKVYVDKNNNGIFDPGEKPIANVLITLNGVDYTGASVTRTTTTNANGAYMFKDLMPGTYNVIQPNQPDRYRDGIDSLGTTFDELGLPMTTPNGLPAPDLNDKDERDGDAFEGIVLNSGFAALDYNFGELAVTTSKADFIRRISYR